MLLRSNAYRLALLQQFPGAAAAYSLRGLSVPHILGHLPVVRVRRSSDNDERDLKWWEITDGTLTTWTGAGNGFVRTWYEQTPNARHAQQATAANQPQIVAGGVLVVHPDGSGKTGIRFLDNSSTAVMAHLATGSAWHGVADAWVGAFSVYSMGGNGFFPALFSDHSGATPERGFVSLHASDTRQVRTATVRTGGLSVANGTAISLNRRYIRTDYANRTNIITLLDGVGAISTTDRNEDFVFSNRVFIGIANALQILSDIYLSEMLFWSTNQATNEPNIRGNINAAWGVY